MFQTWHLPFFPYIFLQFLSLYCFGWKILVLLCVTGTRAEFWCFQFPGAQVLFKIEFLVSFSPAVKLVFISVLRSNRKNMGMSSSSWGYIDFSKLFYLLQMVISSNHPSKPRLAVWYALQSLTSVVYHNWKCLTLPSYFTIFLFHCLLLEPADRNQNPSAKGAVIQPTLEETKTWLVLWWKWNTIYVS